MPLDAPARRQRGAAEFRLALAMGLVGGLALGAREALLTLNANAFVQPEQYFFLYLAMPLLTCMALGVLVLLPCSAVFWIARRRMPSRSPLPLYAAVLACAGTLTIAAPGVTGSMMRLHAVGVSVGLGGACVLWALAMILAGAAAAIAGAAGAWYAGRTSQPLRHATPAALGIALLLLWPLGRFVASDWRWEEPRHSASAAVGLPNVVLISIDTLRSDQLGSYGNRLGLTPHLDQLAAGGVMFEEAITAAPWTLPAMASVFTGLDPHHHGAGAITNRHDPLGRSAVPPGSWTLATSLHDRGYRTHAIVTNPYLALRYGFGPGFDGYENLTVESEVFLVTRETTAGRLLAWLRPDLVIADRGETVSARAVRWLGTVGSERPFFLWLHYIDPHPPYSRAGETGHKSFRGDSLFGAAAIEPALTLTSPDVARLRSGEIRLNAEEQDVVRALYRAEVARVDAAVGDVLGALERRGLAAETLVVCLSDHGEEFWEHGGVEHGHTVYDELVRVPLLVRWPGHVPAGARAGGVVRLTDVAPTILDLLGLPAPAAQDGSSLVPLLRGEAVAPRAALVENLLFAEERRALRTHDRKYIRWANGKEEVYDLAADPLERRDLAGVEAIASPLRTLYAERISRQTAAARAATESAPAASHAALRALGYVQ
jgi:arylsulfatase A-like enzyme